MFCTAISVPNLHLKTTACALHCTLVWGKWAMHALPPLVTVLLTSHQSGSCSLDPGWHIHRQSKPGLAGTCILQSRASPGTTLLWADGTAANGREEYSPDANGWTKSIGKYAVKHFNDKMCWKPDTSEWKLEHRKGWRKMFYKKWNGKVISWILRWIIYFGSILKENFTLYWKFFRCLLKMLSVQTRSKTFEEAWCSLLHTLVLRIK